MNPNDPPYDFALSTTGFVSARCRAIGFARFADLAKHVRRLPYGRIDQTNSETAVLDEGKGTCSSKHALLARVALEAGRTDIELVLGMFEMNARNSPGVALVLSRNSLAYIPEAHCYLRVNGQRIDYTGVPQGSESPFDSLMFEERIDPEDVVTRKSARHRAFIEEWSVERGLDPHRVWLVREECIQALGTGG